MYKHVQEKEKMLISGKYCMPPIDFLDMFIPPRGEPKNQILCSLLWLESIFRT